MVKAQIAGGESKPMVRVHPRVHFHSRGNIMIILEIFFALFIVALILFGKIEFSSHFLKVYLTIKGIQIPLISISRKKDTDNVSI